MSDVSSDELKYLTLARRERQGKSTAGQGLNENKLVLTELVLIYLFGITVDVNECAGDPCDGNATCNNTNGSYTCTCDPGFTGDGFNCSGM